MHKSRKNSIAHCRITPTPPNSVCVLEQKDIFLNEENTTVALSKIPWYHLTSSPHLIMNWGEMFLFYMDSRNTGNT